MLDNVDAALESAIASHEAGDLLVAGEKYLEILKADPSHPDANHNFGLLTVKLGEPAMGVQFLRTAIETNPTVAQYWVSIINTLLEIKDVENAKIALEKAKEVGHADEVFEKLASNIELLRTSSTESETV
jgi:tetratricopeptide (TPR) repeat protein|tara:strand:- start:207 stop:596 length:390 start_codon:yes stop_codon:yes gene_type:complete